jgi:hypothetical protein
MLRLLHYIPIITTVCSIIFAARLYRHWRQKPHAYYLLWWFLGVVTYAVGTITESYTTLFGWHLPVFKAWYISGALLGGAPLAQGTVYLFFKTKTAHRMTAVLVTFITIAAIAVILSPVNYALVETYRPSGKVLVWTWVRAFSPFINTYALIFLAGGAAWSAWQYHRSQASPARMWGNVMIAVGGLLPGIGGTFTRFGYVEVLYVTELIGVLLIWRAYSIMTHDAGASVHANQQQTALPAT